MSDLTEEEDARLIEAFNKLKKAHTSEDLESWLKTYAAEAAVKTEPGTTTATTTAAATVVTTNQYPRISLFYGDKVKREATCAQWVCEVKCLLIENT